jgi:hypothetical protein
VQAIIYIWAEPGTVDEIVTAHEADEQVSLAYGANWTVELTSAGENVPDVATAIADAAGGTTPA